MKVLILTQRVDIDNPGLGFFHRWIEEFSKHCDSIVVVCLGKGKYKLPNNVEVLSLGKESGGSRVSYIFLFYKYIILNLGKYDTVFVHMNQEYVLLGGVIWKIFKKKILFWRNHPDGSFLTDIAAFLSDNVFCTSKYSYTAKFKKTNIMPVGIDNELFKRNPEIVKIPNSILFLGRISPVKKPDLLIRALGELKEKGVKFNALIVGDYPPKDTEYYNSLVEDIEKYGLKQNLLFTSGVRNEETVAFYNKYEIFVNLTPAGSMDKTIFEAMACGSLVLVSNNSLRGHIDDMFILGDENYKTIAEKLERILGLTSEEYSERAAKLTKYVVQEHGLDILANKLFSNNK